MRGPKRLDNLVLPERDKLAELVLRYRHLTGTILPAGARQKPQDWPVLNDHCFQRIVLDVICGGVWYDYIARPAYKNLSLEQASRAVQLCEDIIAGLVDIEELNQRSLSWRRKHRAL